MRSEQINELATALAKAQGSFAPVIKDKTATVKGQTRDGKSYEYKYNYADLGGIIQAAKEALSANGLAILQPTIEDDACLYLETLLIHSSGQWIASRKKLSQNLDPQKHGGEMTYHRRYQLSALLGIATEDDDDGATASQDKPEKKQAPPTPERRPREATPPNGTAAKPQKLNVGQQKFYDSVQQATGDYYKDPAHLLNVTDWPNFSNQDSVEAALSQAVDHWREKQAAE